MAPLNVQVLPPVLMKSAPSAHQQPPTSFGHNAQMGSTVLNGGSTAKSGTKRSQKQRSPKKFMVYPVEEDGRARAAARLVVSEHTAWSGAQWKRQTNGGAKQKAEQRRQQHNAEDGHLDMKVLAQVLNSPHKQGGHLSDGGPISPPKKKPKEAHTHSQQPEAPLQPSPVVEVRQSKRGREESVQVPPVVRPNEVSTPPERMGTRRSKVIMLGDSGVGKTSIVFSYKYGSGGGALLPSNATIGASYTNFELTVLQNVPVQLQLWDTAGQERFRCMVPMYMRNASAAVLVYDITDRSSFDEIDKWYSEISRCSTFDDPVVVLIGNKADQQAHREVAEGEGVAKALRLRARFFEISAIDTEVIRSIFHSLAEQIVSKCASVEGAQEAYEGMALDEEPVSGADAKNGGGVVRLGLGWLEGAEELWAHLASKWRDQPQSLTTVTGKQQTCCSTL